jgi:hypothetical protein
MVLRSALIAAELRWSPPPRRKTSLDGAWVTGLDRSTRRRLVKSPER